MSPLQSPLQAGNGEAGPEWGNGATEAPWQCTSCLHSGSQLAGFPFMLPMQHFYLLPTCKKLSLPQDLGLFLHSPSRPGSKTVISEAQTEVVHKAAGWSGPEEEETRKAKRCCHLCAAFPVSIGGERRHRGFKARLCDARRCWPCSGSQCIQIL